MNDEVELISPSEERRRLRKEQIQQELLKESIPFKKAFGTPDGQDALNLLKKEFYDRSKIVGSDIYATIEKAAQRDLIRYIIDMVEYTGE